MGTVRAVSVEWLGIVQGVFGGALAHHWVTNAVGCGHGKRVGPAEADDLQSKTEALLSCFLGAL
jgi:hypothetical protein